jgi:hypothetical protein
VNAHTDLDACASEARYVESTNEARAVYVVRRSVTPNPSLKRRPATAATAWPLQAIV